MIVMPKYLTALMLAFSSSALAYELSEPKVLSHLDEPLNIEIPVSGSEDGYVRLASTHEYLRLGLTPITIPLAITMEGEGANKKAVITSPHKIDNAGFEILVETNQDGKPKFYNIPVMLNAVPEPVIETKPVVVADLGENVSVETSDKSNETAQVPTPTPVLTKAEKAKLAKEEKARLKAEKAEKLKQEKEALKAAKQEKADKIKAEKAEVARIKAEKEKKSDSTNVETSASTKDDSIKVNKVVSYKPSGRTFGPVQTKDTLWSIAGVMGAKGKQQQQMVDAIKILNPSAFFGSKMKTGVILQIPDLNSKHYVNVPIKQKEKNAPTIVDTAPVDTAPMSELTDSKKIQSDSSVNASESEKIVTEKADGVPPDANTSLALDMALPLATEPVLSLNDDVAEAEGDADPYVIKQMIPVPGMEPAKPVVTDTKPDSTDNKKESVVPQTDNAAVPKQEIDANSKSSATEGPTQQVGLKPNLANTDVKKGADVAPPQVTPKPKPKPIPPLPVEKTFIEDMIDMLMAQIVLVVGAFIALIALVGGLIFVKKRNSLKALEKELAMMNQEQTFKSDSAAIPMATVESTSFVVKSLHEDLKPIDDVDIDQLDGPIEAVSEKENYIAELHSDDSIAATANSSKNVHPESKAAPQTETFELNFEIPNHNPIESVEKKTPRPIVQPMQGDDPEQGLSFDFITPEADKQIPKVSAPKLKQAEILDEGLSFDFSLPEPAAQTASEKKPVVAPLDGLDEGLSFDFSIPEPAAQTASEKKPVVAPLDEVDEGLSFDFSLPEPAAQTASEKKPVIAPLDEVDEGLSFDFSIPDEIVDVKKQPISSESMPVIDDMNLNFEIPAVSNSANVITHNESDSSDALAEPFDFALDDDHSVDDVVTERADGEKENLDNVFKSTPVEIHEAMPLDDFAEFNLPENNDIIEMPIVSSDETNAVKLELAEAYLNFDPELAEPILLEVLKDSSADHQMQAQQFLDQIYAKRDAQIALGETIKLRSQGNPELLSEVTATQLKPNDKVVVTVEEENDDEGNESDSVKLELAEAYLAFDATLAKPLLIEVLRDGSPKQKAKAQALLNDVG